MVATSTDDCDCGSVIGTDTEDADGDERDKRDF